MAITRALMKRQMYNMGGPALEAGAPDLRLTGDQRNRGSYTQRRRAQMAGGGITNARQGYFLGGVTDFISDLIPNEIKDPIAKVIPNELKNPAGAIAAATALNYLPKAFGDYDTVLEQLGDKFPSVLGDDSLIGKGLGTAGEVLSNIGGGIVDILTYITNKNNSLGLTVGDILGMGKDQ